MRMICLETTDRQGSIALYSAGKMVEERTLAGPQRTAQSFAPVMRQLVQGAGWSFDQIQRVAVAAGPGSFTGLRIGVTAAKTLAYLTGAELLGVNTLDTIAWRYFHAENAIKFPPTVWAVIDAQRSQVFVACYMFDADSPTLSTCREPTAVCDVEAWLKRLAPGEAVSGPALLKVAALLPSETSIVDEALWLPTAAAVGQIAQTEFAAGRRDDPFQLTPNYFRLSAAEEKRAAEA